MVCPFGFHELRCGRSLDYEPRPQMGLLEWVDTRGRPAARRADRLPRAHRRTKYQPSGHVQPRLKLLLSHRASVCDGLRICQSFRQAFMSGWVACLELGRIGKAMREHGQGNPRSPYVGIIAMIPGPRASYPRDGPMSCGDQPAHISLIHRRYKSARRVTYTVRLA